MAWCSSALCRLAKAGVVSGSLAFGVFAPSVSGAVVIFDDADGEGWERGWQTKSQTTHVYEGTTALTGDGLFSFRNQSGIVGSEHILEFYANTTDETPAVQLFIVLQWTDADGTTHDVAFSNRNVAATYYIDDELVTVPSGGFDLDTNPATWQKVQLDLTQTVYTGWPYLANTYVPGVDKITLIAPRAGESGQIANVVIDSVRLIPEPASLSLLGLSAGMLPRRRRGW